MRKILLLVLIFSTSILGIKAQQVQLDDATRRAESFWKTLTPFQGNIERQLASLTLVYQGGNLLMPDYYVFNVKGGGYVVVSGDDRMTNVVPIYSLTSTFDEKTMPDPFREMLKTYSTRVNSVRASKTAPVAKKLRSVTPLAQTTTVGPLLGDIAYHQEAPYNAMCPNNGLTGCGATAMVQIMKYYNWPNVGVGSKTDYSTSPWTTIDYSKQTYDWTQILPVYGSSATVAQKNEVAKINYHAGFSFDMRYSPNGSGTDASKITPSISYHFSYSKNVKLAFRLGHTDEEWNNTIRKEIDMQRPIIFSARGDLGDHLFVCDGYDSENRFHFNYGWGGYLNHFAEMDLCQFPLSQKAIIGIYPNNKMFTDEQQAAPQLCLLTPINVSAMSTQLGAKFNVGFRLANYNTADFNDNIGIALFKGKQMVGGAPLKQVTQLLKASSPSFISSNGIEYDIDLTDVVIPATVAAGDYTLGLVVKQGTVWFPALGYSVDVDKKVDVTIANNTASFSYETYETSYDLRLSSPIDVNVANNLATIRFGVQNVDEFYECTNTDIAVLVVPNNSTTPKVWARVKIESLSSGLVQEFEVKDVAVPPGVDVKSCKYYIAYNRMTPSWGKMREVSCVPMEPFNYNFKTYQIPAEVKLTTVNFAISGGIAVPATYKQFDENWKDTTGFWIHDMYTPLSKASTSKSKAKLATTPIRVPDENTVLEWQMGNMYSQTTTYVLYVSTDGQNFENAKTPVYSKEMLNKGIARFNLADYAGKDISIAFEAPVNGLNGLSSSYSLLNYSLLNIKTPKDISIEGASVGAAVLDGQSVPVKMTVKNSSAATVRKITATYTIGTEKVTEDFVANIPFNETQELVFVKKIIAKGVAGDIVPVTIEVKLDGEAVDQLGNNTKTVNYTVVNFYPRKSMLAFKSSQANCTGCKDSYGKLDDLETAFPATTNFVELWRNTALITPGFDMFQGGNAPSFYLNGNYTFLQALSPTIRELYPQLTPPAEVTVTAAYESANSRKLKIQLRANFAMPVKGTFKLGAIVIENNVKNVIGEIAGTYPTGDKLTRNHIPVGIIGSCNGATGFEIKDPLAQEYFFETEMVIPDELTYSGQATSYRYRKDNVQVIGVLYGTNGEILNSGRDIHYLKLPETAGLKFIPTEGYGDLKLTYDVEQLDKKMFVSRTNYRATMVDGGTYKFKIEKDATWNGRYPKLIVNKHADGQAFVEEQLYPDENGVYTIHNALQHYFVTIESMEEGDAMITRKGSQLQFSGNWTLGDFKKLKLTDATVTGLELSDVTIPQGVGVIDVPNPNALIYTAAESAIPTTWTNVVNGVMASNISLTDGYPFYNSKEFTADAISFQRNYTHTGFSTLCLPFYVADLPQGIISEKYAKNRDAKLSFERKKTIEANIPYVLEVKEEGAKLFAANNAIVPMTNLVGVAQGDYTFDGVLESVADDKVAGAYLINTDGSLFLKKVDQKIMPFSAYIRYTGTALADDQLTAEHADDVTSSHMAATQNKGIVITYRNGVTELIAPQACTVELRTIDSRVVKVMNLQSGVNPVCDLLPGFYFVDGKTLIIR